VLCVFDNVCALYLCDNVYACVHVHVKECVLFGIM